MGDRRKKRRVLHSSDLHLEKPGDSACEDLRAVVDAAIRSEAELVLIAGDFFDHNRVDDELIKFAAGQLGRLEVPTVILPGNHDCLLPGCAYERDELWSECQNVRIIREPDGEIMNLPELGIRLWGKSINSYDGDFRPMGGIPKPREDGQWNIAVAHGYFVSTTPPFFYSYLIEEEEIVKSGWDYIALGHIAVFRCVCEEPVKAYYCGSPSITGTVNIVELSEETGVQVTRYPL
jgi:exonuclease SbcD